jgi:hypothetical protein
MVVTAGRINDTTMLGAVLDAVVVPRFRLLRRNRPSS